MAKELYGLTTVSLGPVTLNRDSEGNKAPIVLSEDVRGGLASYTAAERDAIDTRMLDNHMIIALVNDEGTLIEYQSLRGGTRDSDSGFLTGGVWEALNITYADSDEGIASVVYNHNTRTLTITQEDDTVFTAHLNRDSDLEAGLNARFDSDGSFWKHTFINNNGAGLVPAPMANADSDYILTADGWRYSLRRNITIGSFDSESLQDSVETWSSTDEHIPTTAAVDNRIATTRNTLRSRDSELQTAITAIIDSEFSNTTPGYVAASGSADSDRMLLSNGAWRSRENTIGDTINTLVSAGSGGNITLDFTEGGAATGYTVVGEGVSGNTVYVIYFATSAEATAVRAAARGWTNVAKLNNTLSIVHSGGTRTVVSSGSQNSGTWDVGTGSVITGQGAHAGTFGVQFGTGFRSVAVAGFGGVSPVNNTLLSASAGSSTVSLGTGEVVASAVLTYDDSALTSADTALEARLDSEVTVRSSVDTALHARVDSDRSDMISRIASEASLRVSGDSDLQDQLDDINIPQTVRNMLNAGDFGLNTSNIDFGYTASNATINEQVVLSNTHVPGVATNTTIVIPTQDSDSAADIAEALNSQNAKRLIFTTANMDDVSIGETITPTNYYSVGTSTSATPMWSVTDHAGYIGSIPASHSSGSSRALADFHGAAQAAAFRDDLRSLGLDPNAVNISDGNYLWFLDDNDNTLWGVRASGNFSGRMRISAAPDNSSQGDHFWLFRNSGNSATISQVTGTVSAIGEQVQISAVAVNSDSDGANGTRYDLPAVVDSLVDYAVYARVIGSHNVNDTAGGGLYDNVRGQELTGLLIQETTLSTPITGKLVARLKGLSPARLTLSYDASDIHARIDSEAVKLAAQMAEHDSDITGLSDRITALHDSEFTISTPGYVPAPTMDDGLILIQSGWAERTDVVGTGINSIFSAANSNVTASYAPGNPDTNVVRLKSYTSIRSTALRLTFVDSDGAAQFQTSLTGPEINAFGFSLLADSDISAGIGEQYTDTADASITFSAGLGVRTWTISDSDGIGRNERILEVNSGTLAAVAGATLDSDDIVTAVTLIQGANSEVIRARFSNGEVAQGSVLSLTYDDHAEVASRLTNAENRLDGVDTTLALYPISLTSRLIEDHVYVEHRSESGQSHLRHTVLAGADSEFSDTYESFVILEDSDTLPRIIRRRRVFMRTLAVESDQFIRWDPDNDRYIGINGTDNLVADLLHANNQALLRFSLGNLANLTQP